ncbi:MAG: TraR/DksA C4-type zinc finger protein [Candidatus Komeilibacteria bacterium]|nr:TraR/DksA C4-type zinc finger protein [Candidatus Komeilibacteria bacterium]
MLSKSFIEQQKQALLQKNEEIESQLKDIVNKDRQSTEYDAMFPDFGDKEEDNAAEVAAYESNLSLEEDLKFSLDRVKYALDAIEKGTYGTCDRCGGAINEERLKAFPQASTCMKCKNGHNGNA